MAIPHQFIKMKLHDDAFVCSSGHTTYALFPGNTCAKCFDFEAERKKKITFVPSGNQKENNKGYYEKNKEKILAQRKKRREGEGSK